VCVQIAEEKRATMHYFEKMLPLAIRVVVRDKGEGERE